MNHPQVNEKFSLFHVPEQTIPMERPASLDDFTKQSEDIFKTRYPLEYETLCKGHDFDPRYFSQNISGDPVYAKGLNNHQLGQKNIIWNLHMWNQLSYEAKATQRKHVQRMAVINASLSHLTR